MVLSSISPLFILWAIRGNGIVPEILVLFCVAMVVLPNLFLLWREELSVRLKEEREDCRIGGGSPRACAGLSVCHDVAVLHREPAHGEMAATLVALASLCFSSGT